MNAQVQELPTSGAPRSRRRRLVAAGAGVAALAVVAGGVAVASTGDPADAAATSTVVTAQDVDRTVAAPTSGSGEQGGWGDVQVPEQMRQDLQDAAALDGDARAQALQSVETKALSGAYGTEVQQGAQQLVQTLQELPSGLVDRVRSLAAAPADERADQLDALLADASAGQLGDRAQQVADEVQQVPEELRDRVVALADVPADQRADAVSTLVEQARAGDFGAQVQAALEQLDRRLQARGAGGLDGALQELQQMQASGRLGG